MKRRNYYNLLKEAAEKGMDVDWETGTLIPYPIDIQPKKEKSNED